MSGKDDWRSSAFIGLGLAGLGIGGGLAAASATLGPAVIPVWGMVFLMSVIGLRSPIAKAMAERLKEGEVAPDEVYAELDELRARVIELEERQDFAERLLASRDGAPRGSRDNLIGGACRGPLRFPPDGRAKPDLRRTDDHP